MGRYKMVGILLLAGLGFDAVADKQVLGWVEHVRIDPAGLKIRAKIDSGAENSSLNCSCSEFFEKGGDQWVRFTVTNFKGDSVRLERKVERIANIKRHFGKSQDRPVIRLGVCLGNTYRETEVNLVDRSGFKYQMLIGRSFMEGDFLIDPEHTYMTQPDCPQIK